LTVRQWEKKGSLRSHASTTVTEKNGDDYWISLSPAFAAKREEGSSGRMVVVQVLALTSASW